MAASRYVRLPSGSIIVQRQALQGVVAHLHDLARHLEGLVPADDSLFDKLTRSRDFTGGFAQRAEYERELDRAVLESLAGRPTSAAYEPLTIQGYSVEQVENRCLSAVERRSSRRVRHKATSGHPSGPDDKRIPAPGEASDGDSAGGSVMLRQAARAGWFLGVVALVAIYIVADAWLGSKSVGLLAGVGAGYLLWSGRKRERA